MAIVGKNILLFTFNSQLTMPNFFSAKLMIAMVPTKEYSIQIQLSKAIKAYNQFRS